MRWIGIVFGILLAAVVCFAAIAPARLVDAKSAPDTVTVGPCAGAYRLNIGQSVDRQGYTIKLTDLTIAEGTGNTHYAVVDILDSNGIVQDMEKIAPGATYVYSGASGKIAITICQTAPGFTLNSKWAKMKVTPTNAPATNPCPGYSTVNVGGIRDNGNIKARLADISVAEGQSNDHPAIVDILDANDAILEKVKIAEGTTYVYSGTGGKTAISICQTAPGYTLSAKWARIKIASTAAAATSTCKGYSTLDIGQSLSAGEYKARLADIAIATGPANAHPAIIKILDSNDVVVDEVSLVGQSYTYNGQFTVSVCQTAPGFTLNAKWAKVKVSTHPADQADAVVAE